MPKKYRKLFQNVAGKRRLIRQRENGVYEIRCQIDHTSISARSKDLEICKQKFIEKLQEFAKYGNVPNKVILSFPEAVEAWLQVKKNTTKPSTYKEYERLCKNNLIPKFKRYTIKTLTRPVIQEYLFSFVNAGKHRTAEKLCDLLTWIFDLCATDAGITSPMARIELPYYEPKKGVALSKEEEKQLVTFCVDNKDSAASSALLVLLYFGLRKSELCTIKVEGEKLNCITSKTRLGRNEVERSMPFTPVFKRVLPYVDFEKARNTNLRTIATTFKRLFPNHHPHELRYTFITRCKECGVNLEVVMLWDGHEEDSDVKSSKIDRGYTDYSEEFLRSEAEKVDYELK